MKQFLTIEDYNAVVAQIRRHTSQRPKVGLILGSGLGTLADSVENAEVIPYADIDGWPTANVQGHGARLVFGTLEGVPVVVMQGRGHYYEGNPPVYLGLPIRVMKLLGVETLIVTNAAGGVNPAYGPGDVMLITDHLGIPGMGGQNPLIGPNVDEFGPRFPDMMHAYNPDLRAKAQHVADQHKLDGIHQGVYAWVSGPSFETSAEIRFLHTVGADAVGMSTAPEVVVARHAGVTVLGMSGISNKANHDGNTETTHEEVLAAGKVIVPKMLTIIRGVLADLG